MIKNEIGKKFRELRELQNITLTKATQNIDNLSVSRVSHWETGDGEIPLSKLNQLLYNIHILPSEFENWAKLRPENQLINNLQKAFIENDLDLILSLSRSQLDIYKNTNKNEDLFLAATGYNLYFQITQKNLLSTNYQQKLYIALSNVDFWSQYYISIFSNTLDLLDSNFVYRLSCSITNNFSTIQKLGLETEIYATTSLLNALNMLTLKETTLAQKLLTKINKLPYSAFNTDSSLRKKFLSHILSYQTSNNKNDYNIANSISNLASLIDRDDLAKELKLTLSKVQNSSK